MTTPLYKCYGCDRQMNAITNNEGNLACAFCGSEFVEEIELPTETVTTNTSPIHSPSPQASNIVDLTNLDDDDIFSRAFSTAVTTPEQNQSTRSSSSTTTTTTRSRTSSSGTPTVHSQTISITIGPNGTTRRTITNATPFNPFGFGGDNNNRVDPLTSLFGGFGGDNNRDPISSIFDALNNASQNVGSNTNQQGTFPRISFGPTMDFSNFMRHIRQPFGNGTTWGDYVFSDNLDDIITRMMEATVGQGGTPPASQDVISKLKHRKAQECDCKDCAVCQDQIKAEEEITELPCGHLYHSGCVTPWLERHANCPICRAEIGNDGSALPPHSHQQQQQQQNNPHNH
ncbi:predicted protein [Naegleria gruberi]|uniref:Predicted protein n=1 Tax=Naegleria gruberi TaxID=5762 RepID=D2VH30_NAEGR|nr:uncharacterized protein NAEGRDRAFT_68257 [Naegleria gruberi]EFC43818.1 predicted protein [Naegleria gruberi]|eukprot:XP_002676562.1 predicted protein [Naegleria gruberi strain NEG-M]